mmetsp:Transcript_84622/g.274144  ORF Transcript_84622/g.274144 Transcript_84622/m.274144 type:complete len:242 (-) Transcript_84622:1060-1785(-)
MGSCYSPSCSSSLVISPSSFSSPRCELLPPSAGLSAAWAAGRVPATEAERLMKGDVAAPGCVASTTSPSSSSAGGLKVPEAALGQVENGLSMEPSGESSGKCTKVWRTGSDRDGKSTSVNSPARLVAGPGEQGTERGRGRSRPGPLNTLAPGAASEGLGSDEALGEASGRQPPSSGTPPSEGEVAGPAPHLACGSAVFGPERCLSVLEPLSRSDPEGCRCFVSFSTFFARLALKKSAFVHA